MWQLLGNCCVGCWLLVIGFFVFVQVGFEGVFDFVVLVIGGDQFFYQFVVVLVEECVQVFFECQNFVDWQIVEIVFFGCVY